MHTHPGERPNYVRDFTMVEVRALRKRTEAAVDALLALLDELEDDADLEPAGDEEDSSWPEGGARFYLMEEDAEEHDPAEEDDPAEDEHDAEDNRDDLEPDAEGEPDLGRWL